MQKNTYGPAGNATPDFTGRLQAQGMMSQLQSRGLENQLYSQTIDGQLNSNTVDDLGYSWALVIIGVMAIISIAIFAAEAGKSKSKSSSSSTTKNVKKKKVAGGGLTVTETTDETEHKKSGLSTTAKVFLGLIVVFTLTVIIVGAVYYAKKHPSAKK